MRTPSTPVTARWLNSMAAARVRSGISLPLQSGQSRPQPCAEPVVVTLAPITSTTNMPAAATTPSQNTARARRSDRLTRGRVPEVRRHPSPGAEGPIVVAVSELPDPSDPRPLIGVTVGNRPDRAGLPRLAVNRTY